VRTRLSLLAAAALVLASLSGVTTRIYASDEVQYFAFLRSLAFDDDLSFQNEYEHFHNAGAGGAGFHDTFLAERFTAAGRRINFGTIGPALLWAPFYAVGHVWAGLTGAPQDGYSHPYIAAVAYGSAIYGWLALWLAIDLTRRILGPSPCTSPQRGWLAPVLLLGTPLVFYMYVAPPFSHACATFAVTLCLWVWWRVRDRWSPGGVILLGLAGGLMGTMRDQTVLFLIPMALDYVRWAAAQPRAIALGRAAMGTVATLVGYAPHLLASWAINGYLGPHESVGNKMSWSSPHALDVLVSVRHGWFLWTPLAALAVAGLVRLALGHARSDRSDLRWIGGCLLLMLALQVYINGAVESWTVAGAFGQRRFVEITPILAIGLAALQPLGVVARRLMGLGLALCVWWNLGLLLQFGTHRMDRQRLTLSDNATVTFIELPLEAPTLAWRYLTDRESFYRQPRQ
jgi:hypothetical protein